MSRVEAFVTRIKTESSDLIKVTSELLKINNQERRLQFDLWPLKIK